MSNVLTTNSTPSVEGVVSAFGEAGELFIAEFTARGLTSADAQEDAAYWVECGEGELSTWYCEVARRLDAARDADPVTVDAGSDAPMHVAREGVSLDADEQQWRVDNAVGLELGRRPLFVDPLAVETQAQFDERMALGYAERATRQAPAQDPFRRLPVVMDEAF